MNITFKKLTDNYIIPVDSYPVFEFLCKELDRLNTEVSRLRLEVKYVKYED